jgi:PAP_fibrillin
MEEYFEDDFDETIVPNETTKKASSEDAPSLRMIQGDDLTPDVLFISLANEEGLVGLEELKRWAELQDMIAEGELLDTELNEIFQRVKKSEMDRNKLDEDGFMMLYKAIDDLFVEGDDEDDPKKDSKPAQLRSNYKQELLEAISDLEASDNTLACGLDASDAERKGIMSIVQDLEMDPDNRVRSRQGAITFQDLCGTWELLYSSSSAMKFNKGLSGLGGSFPNGRFGSLQQRLTSSKFLTDVEYIERIEVNPSSASFDVKVTGTWDLRTSVSLFTGEPSIVMTVEPDRVAYGPTSTRADHWKSLGPLNMLDITYLDDDLRIMRGNTSVETIFVFRRIS